MKCGTCRFGLLHTSGQAAAIECHFNPPGANGSINDALVYGNFSRFPALHTNDFCFRWEEKKSIRDARHLRTLVDPAATAGTPVLLEDLLDDTSAP